MHCHCAAQAMGFQGIAVPHDGGGKGEPKQGCDRPQVQHIIDHGINCFVNRQLIYNFPEEIFADAGVMAIEHADFDGIERLALVTGEASPGNTLLTITPRIRFWIVVPCM